MPVSHPPQKSGGSGTSYHPKGSGVSHPPRGSKGKPRGFSEIQAYAKAHPGSRRKGGLTGALENLAHGAEASIIGIPNAVVTTAGAVGTDVGKSLSRAAHGDVAELAKANPVGAVVGIARGHGEVSNKVVKPIAKSYQYKYGPLFHGKPGKTLHRALQEDPFGTLMDIATIASLGSAGVGKVLPAEATALRELPVRGPEALAKAGKLKGPKRIIASEKPSVIGGRAIRGPAVRETTLHKITQSLPANTPVFGELRRYGQALNKLPREAAAARRLRAVPLDRELRKLTASERQATALLGRWPLPRLLDQMVERWRALEATGEDVGALRIATDPKVRALYENPSPRMLRVVDEARKLGQADSELLGRYGALSSEASADVPWLHMRVASGAKFEEPVAAQYPGDVATPGRFYGGQSIDELRSELAATGRPDPFYLHDTALDKPAKTQVEAMASGGGTSPIPRSPVKQNRAVLASMGQLILDPMTLVSQHFRTVKYALYRDIHSTLESEAAVRVPKGTHLPDGWQYLRRAEGPKGKTAEAIPYTEQTAGSYHQWVEQTLSKDEDLAKLGDSLTTKNIEDAAVDANGDRLMVPTKVVKQMTGEFQRSSAAARNLIERPLDVWRAILLNWSPRWLVNNLVGNTFMALVQEGGPKFVKLWLQAVKERGGPAAIDRLAHDSVTSRLTANDFAELFPGQVTGTFKGQNMPFQNGGVSGLAQTRIGGRAKQFLKEGLSPIDRGYEQALRRAVGNSRIQKSAEAQRIYKQMPKDARNWRAASKQALKENPALAKKIEQEINARLGDFTSLSAPERNWIRRLIPFYGWYRAILGVTLRLPVESPIRANILFKLAQMQQEEQDLLNPDLPQYQRGSVVVPGGGIVLTQGVNPYGTVPQLARGTVTDPLGTTNPMIQAIAGTGRTFYEPTSLPELLMALYQGMYGGLPPVQGYNIARHGARPSSVYEPRALDQILSLFGVPLRHPVEPVQK